MPFRQPVASEIVYRHPTQDRETDFMVFSRIGARAALAGLMLSAAPIAALHAAEWPTQAVRLIVPFPAGGGTDVPARALAEGLSQRYGTPFIVENRPGAGGAIGTQTAVQADDGHTLLFASSGHVTVPLVNSNVEYDIFEDFKAVSLLVEQPFVFTANSDVPVETLEEALALIAEQPGVFNYGSAGAGSGHHLHAELLQHLTGVELFHVPFNGQPDILNDLVAGRIEFSFVVLAGALPYIESGDLRPLALVSRERSDFAPEVPTFSELGIDLATRTWFGLLAPSQTPDEVVARLYSEISSLAEDEGFQQVARNARLNVVNDAPEEFEVEIEQSYAQWEELVTTLDLEF